MIDMNSESNSFPKPCSQIWEQLQASRSGITPGLFAVLACLGSGLLGSTITQSAWARPVLNDTSHFLVAQQVVDGLPPPPPVIFGQEALATGQSQSVQQYLVVINSDSQALLSQIQQIQPTASLQEYNGQRFIQAGLFSDPTSAQQQVSTLAASGIGAQVVPVTSTASGGTAISQAPAANPAGTGMPTYDGSTGVNALPPPEVLPTTTVPSAPGEVEFGSSSSPAAPATRESGTRAYYVIIPGNGKDLNAMTTQISRLTSGMGIDGMVQTGTARGNHVRIGPFNSSSAAGRWSRYFRDFGMDARVSYIR